ncbi:MAG TPA: AlpA family phage regulatory protein [Burkholderiales bacterium]|nr:AlpA family phage regulatory protein [Burkholderiales bacterium]
MTQAESTSTAAHGSGQPTLLRVIAQELLRPKAACVFLGVSRNSLHRWSETDPTFPRKIVLSKRCVGYRADSLRAWLASKESA